MLNQTVGILQFIFLPPLGIFALFIQIILTLMVHNLTKTDNVEKSIFLKVSISDIVSITVILQ